MLPMLGPAAWPSWAWGCLSPNSSAPRTPPHSFDVGGADPLLVDQGTGGVLGPPPLPCHHEGRQTDDRADPELAHPTLRCFLGGPAFRLCPLQDLLLEVFHARVLPPRAAVT